MSISIQPMNELSNRAKHALIEELGVVDAMRFLSQFRAGSGNYTTERDQLFKGESVENISAGIRSRRSDEA